ncbi:MAG: hypothetical protein Kow00109_21270 [Acidobacteriota bacterium]
MSRIGSELLTRLTRCCGLRRPALITLGGSGTLYSGRFLSCSFSTRTVLFALDKNETSQNEPAPNERCTIVFADRGRTWVFSSPVREWIAGADEVRLAAEFPTQIVPLESRRWPRLPVAPRVGLSVRVLARGRIWQPEAVDLSPAAVLTRFLPGDGPPTGYVANLIVELALGSLRVRLRGFAEHRGDNVYVIYFADILRGLRHRRYAPPEPLRAILERLQAASSDPES